MRAGREKLHMEQAYLAAKHYPEMRIAYCSAKSNLEIRTIMTELFGELPENLSIIGRDHVAPSEIQIFWDEAQT